MKKTRLAAAAVFGCLCAAPAARAADEGFGAAETPIPKLQPASDAGERAIAKMKPAPGLKIELFAAEPLFANPVALNFDDQGRCYVVETWRFEHGVIDMRGYADWLHDDLMCQSVEDRMKLVKRKMGPNARSFGRYPDVIRRLEDTSNTGRADKSTVFAEFSAADSGVAAGVVCRKNDVYVTDIPDLWLLKDANGDGKADVRKSLSYGYGVRYNYLGHDLHGPRFGPDGKLYFTIGDRGANVTRSVDGSKVKNVESGSVFRCDPDGSHLEIYAIGLRNPQCLAFDDYGNLFTGDNNPDYGDPARWVCVVEAGDSGWRVGYQWDHNPIGGGPWMWEHLWQTQDKSNAYYLIPPIAHLGAWPSGVAYYPGTGLSDSYKDHFFECDFRGGFTGSGVHTFVMKPKGAGFEMAGLRNFVWDTLATDIAFGPRGGAYVTDWVEGWHASGKGRIYHVFDPQAMSDPIVAQVKNLLAEGFEKRSSPELIGLLGHRDQRIRQRAQFELADRGPAAVPLLADVARKNDSQLARIHAIWALGEIATKAQDALNPILPLLGDGDPEIRAQAARVLGDHRDVAAYDALVKLTSDPSLRVRYFATMGLAKLGHQQAIGPVLQMLRENDGKDVYLRHAGMMALVWIDDPASILSAARDQSWAVRMAALEAMRRLKMPQVAMFLHDSDPRFVLEAARAINDVPIVPAMPQLASLITEPNLPDYVAIRVVNANYRLGTAQSAAALANFAGSPSAPQRWRVEALNDLANWQSPGDLDRVTNLPRPLPDRDPAIARDAVGPELAQILKTAPSPVRVAALALVRKLGVKNSAVLSQLAGDAEVSADVRIGAIQTLAAQDDPALPDVIAHAMHDPNDHVRAEAIRASARLPDAAPRIEAVLGKESILEQQAAFAALGSVPSDAADSALASWMDKLIAGQVRPELELDVLDAASSRQSPEVRQRVEKWEQSRPRNDELAPFRVALRGGDAAAGEKIFRERAAVSCVRCHTIHGSGGIVGPVLDGIGAKQTREYLLESIVFPNAKIAPGFETLILRTRDGHVSTGVLRNETPTALNLVDADGKLFTINKADIQSRQRGQSAMPEGFGKILSRKDLRDLVEFLAELKR